jgi:hypothetical protein
MSFFALPKPVWKLTDDELVELARKRARWAKRLKLPITILLVVMAVTMCLAFGFAISTLIEAELEAGAMSRQGIFLGTLMGVLFGFVMGLSLAVPIFFTYMAIEDGRRDELLVGSWDRIKQLGPSGEPSGNSKVNAATP